MSLPTMPTRRATYAALLLVSTLASSRPAGAKETLRYRWKLDGFVGALASLFVPGGGEGVLSLTPLANGNLESELLVTASERARGDFFRYGAEWQPSSGRTVRAWSDLVWRGERKTKQADVDQPGVIDIVSGIHTLRRDPPKVARRSGTRTESPPTRTRPSAARLPPPAPTPAPEPCTPAFPTVLPIR